MEVLATLGFGALIGVVVKAALDARHARTVERRHQRRALYQDMLTLLIRNRQVLEYAGWDLDNPPADVAQQAELAALDARLDASQEVQDLADRCFKLISRFWASYSMRAPIDVGEHGLYQYRHDLVAGRDDEARAMVMRMSLGSIHDDLRKAVDELVARMRAEL